MTNVPDVRALIEFADEQGATLRLAERDALDRNDAFALSLAEECGKTATVHEATAAALRRLVAIEAEHERLRGLLTVRVLCGGCGQRYTYNKADDPQGHIAEREHAKLRRGQCGDGPPLDAARESQTQTGTETTLTSDD